MTTKERIEAAIDCFRAEKCSEFLELALECLDQACVGRDALKRTKVEQILEALLDDKLYEEQWYRCPSHPEVELHPEEFPKCRECKQDRYEAACDARCDQLREEGW